MTKAEHTTSSEPIQQPQDSWLAITSLILGILGMAGFGFLTGVPAIVTGTIALGKKQANRGMSIAGIIMGIISTIISLLIVMALIAAVVFGVDAINGVEIPNYTPEDFMPSQDWVNSSRT